MAWKEVSRVDARREFMRIWESDDGPPLSQLVEEFGISRKTAYKWIDRYLTEGEEGLRDRSRAPHHHPNATSEHLEQMFIEAREGHPFWGAKKLVPWLKARHPEIAHWPAVSTVSSILSRHQLVKRRTKRQRVQRYEQPLTGGTAPNDVWCIDHKGWWCATNGEKCEPLTVTDSASRYIVRSVLLPGKGVEWVRPTLALAFEEYGLPLVILSDNGPPFASRAPHGLSQLSVWMMRLGVRPERIAPGMPQQNGRHERMHLTLEMEVARPPACSRRAQQLRLNAWRKEFNEQRPHEAIGFQTPAALYHHSPRPMPRRLPPIEYPPTMRVRKVDCGGEFYWKHEGIFVSEVLRGEYLGFQPTEHDGIWRVWFATVPLGWFDERARRFRTDPPSGQKRRRGAGTHSPPPSSTSPHPFSST